jgi:hypothetical protein
MPSGNGTLGPRLDGAGDAEGDGAAEGAGEARGGGVWGGALRGVREGLLGCEVRGLEVVKVSHDVTCYMVFYGIIWLMLA